MSLDLMESMEPIISTALREAHASGRKEGLEEAAKLSERVWLDAHDTEWDRGVNSAKRVIASAIRALGTEGEKA